MSLSDTLITYGNPASIIYKDILRPANTQNLGGGFTQGVYRVVNITDPITSLGVQMFYVEVFGASGSSGTLSAQLPIPNGLLFTKAYCTLHNNDPGSPLRLFMTWATKELFQDWHYKR
jgi:hypothetical protein